MLFYFVVLGCMIFVYWDATRNNIGKIPGEKGFTNSSAGMWAVGTGILWIVIFPLYLINRKKLIEKAKENPQVVPKWRPVAVTASLLAVFALMLMGQFGNATPTCTDSTVKELVIKILKESAASDLAVRYSLEHWQYLPEEFGRAAMRGYKIKISEFEEYAEKDEKVKKILDMIKADLAQTTVSLNGIRINASDDKAKKCECGASAVFRTHDKTKEISVTYTAQSTEDGQVYVEVAGL